MKSTIQITFNKDISNPDETISFDLKDLLLDESVNQSEIFVDRPRIKVGEIPLQDSSAIEGQATAQAFAKYFGYDYNSNNKYNISINQNVVTIETEEEDKLIFENFNSSSSDVLGDIFNTTLIPFIVNDFEFSEADEDKCDFIKVEIEVNKSILDIKLNNELLSNDVINNNVASVNIPRNTECRFVIRTNDNGQIQQLTFPNNLQLPLYCRALSPMNYSVDITQSISNNTVFINSDVQIVTENIPNPALNIEYSLDGNYWFTETILTGQEVGEYTLYIKDQFGCIVSINYVITLLGFRKPYIDISKANDIGFFKREDIDNIFKLKNDKNSSACETLKNVQGINETEILHFCIKDKGKIEVKTNYSDLKAYLRNDQNEEEELSVIKKSNNINKFGSHDAVLSITNNRLSIYFTEGNTYNENGIQNGLHQLNGNLPEYARINNIINIQGVGDFLILDVYFDYNNNRKVIIISEDTSIPIISNNIIVSCIYDLLPFEVYHIIYNFNSKLEGIYDMYIRFINNNSTDALYQSENIYLSEIHPETLFIEYWNNHNRDVFYSYGIKHNIRIPFEKITALIDDNNEINIGDDNVSLINSELNDGNTFVFDELTRDTTLKLAIALSCENVFINNIGYVKKASLNIENIENTNLYKVTAQMIKNNEIKSIGTQLLSETYTQPVDFPRLSVGDENLLKH